LTESAQHLRGGFLVERADVGRGRFLRERRGPEAVVRECEDLGAGLLFGFALYAFQGFALLSLLGFGEQWNRKPA